MPKWSGDAVPLKYRHLQKRIAAIEEALRELPEPRVDFFALTPKEQDLIETYYRCLTAMPEDNSQYGLKQEFGSNKNAGFSDELIELLSHYLTDTEIGELPILLKKMPLIIEKEFNSFWNRPHPPQLMNFLVRQQDIYQWIPSPAKLNPAQLTWKAWHELLQLAKVHGYDAATDDISNLQPLEKWSVSDKKQIVHLYLEMISSKRIIDSFLAVQNYNGEPPKLRKRLR